MNNKVIQKILNKFLQIIRQADYSVVDADTSEYPKGQATSDGKPTNIVRMSTYGICANPPKACHILMLQNQGQESTKFGIFNDFLNRKKGLAEGECALYNTLTGAIVYMKADGSIAIESPASIDAAAPVINIDADTEVSVTAPTINAVAGTVLNAQAPTINVIASTAVNVTAPTATVTASTKAVIDSPLVELGDGTIQKLVNKLGMDVYNSHDHPYFDSGSGPETTDAPNQLMVEDTDTTTETKGS